MHFSTVNWQPILVTIAIFTISAWLIHLIAKPLHLAGRLLVTAISGLVFIFLFNKISRYTNLHILLPINWLTVSISGLFGIMGVLILVIWQMLV